MSQFKYIPIVELDKKLSYLEKGYRISVNNKNDIIKISMIDNRESISFKVLEDINTILDVDRVEYDKRMNELYIFTSFKNGA